MATHKGYFIPRNPSKYKGDPSNIIYRSRWESVLMSRLDRDPNVLWWQSEETVVPYRSPIDNRIHRYYVDFTVRIRDSEGKTKTKLIEVKPASQCRPPAIMEGRKTKRYINEVLTWGVNSAKWKAAREYCRDRGFEFVIMTEKELGIKF